MASIFFRIIRFDLVDCGKWVKLDFLDLTSNIAGGIVTLARDGALKMQLGKSNTDHC